MTRVLAARLCLAVSRIRPRRLVFSSRSECTLWETFNTNINVYVDLHLGNTLVGLSSGFAELSIDRFREKFDEPDMVPVTRVDGKPLTANVPTHAVVSMILGKPAEDFTIAEARALMLCDFVARHFGQPRKSVWAGIAIHL